MAYPARLPVMSVSERLRAFIESEAHYRDTVENANDLIVTVDLDGTIVGVNATFERTIGHARDELVGMPLGSLVGPEWHAQLEDATIAKLTGALAQTVYDLELVTKVGTMVPVEVSSRLVHVDGEPVGVQAICRDLRERNDAERALRFARDALFERDDLLQRAFENTTIGMLVISAQGRIVTPNRAFCDLLGYEPEELRRMTVADITHPDDRAETTNALPRLVTGELQRYAAEKRYVRKDGGLVWGQVGASPVRNSSGKVTALMAQVVDVTGRREADAAVRESEALFRAAFEGAAIGMLMTNQSGAIVQANEALCELLGYQPSELRGMDVVGLTHPDDRAETEAAFPRLKAGELATFVTKKRYLHKDGRPVWVEIAASPVRDPKGEMRCHVTQVIDLTQSRTNEERFRLLFESSPHGMDIVDADGTLLEVNPALECMLGYERDELLRLCFADITHPDDSGEDLHLFAEMLRGERSHYALDKRCLGKDGRTIWVHLTAFALPDADPTPRFAIGVLEDITERRTLEEQLRRAQRLEAVGQLAGGIAHDFNNLLTAISTYCDLATGALPGDADERARTSIDGARGAADRAANLTRQLLAFSRQQVLKPTLIDLNAIVTADAPMLERLLGDDIEVRLALDPEAAMVTMDAGQLDQILINLAVNARDAMENGGTLTINTNHVDLDQAPTTTGFVSGPHAMLEVSDTGTGMDADTIARIFEPFFTTKEPGKGTGLGLATVLGIVEQSGGRVNVYSEPGLGTSLKVYFPSAAASPAAAPPADAPDTRPTGSESILLVEDNDAVRAPIASLLADLGYHVLAATGPEHALQLAEAEAESVDLLVTDVVMPAMNGPQLADVLRPSRPDMKVLYMSGYTNDAALSHGVNEPATAFLQKPFGADQLARTIRQLLDDRISSP